MPILERKAEGLIADWYRNRAGRALLVTGARQVGKTYLVRKFAREHWPRVAEINFLEDAEARDAIRSARSSRELFLRLSAFSPVPLVAGETVVFLDEIQELDDPLTAVKFLVERGDFDYILSGSMLGVELKDVRSAPVGFLSTVTMYPLDFEEFCWSNGVGAEAIEEARGAFGCLRPVDPYVHERLLELLHRYLICGGMPDAVVSFNVAGNVTDARVAQEAIITQYRHDISKYAGSRARIVRRIFDLMPSEVSRPGKRFVVRDIEGNSHADRYEYDFLWLADANAALPVYNVTEPRYPLRTAMEANKFKLFSSDVGLLTYQCGMNVVRDVAARRRDINFGALFENFVAQELACHGHDLLYFKNRTVGELDFVLQREGRVVPVEVKSGKDYRHHSALDHALSVPDYGIERAYVLCTGNVEQRALIAYVPAYMAMFL